MVAQGFGTTGNTKSNWDINKGIHLNYKTVQRLVKELGLAHVRPKKYRSCKGEVNKIAPNLLNWNFYAE